MTSIRGTTCPFGKGAEKVVDKRCNTNCMLFLTSSEDVEGDISKGEGQCGLAVLASHVASEEHFGGNYLMKVVRYGSELENDEKQQVR